MKLQQISKVPGEAGVNLFTEVAKLYELYQAAEFKYHNSTFANVPNLSTFTSSSARAVNAALQSDSQAPNPTQVQLALYGREAPVDDVYFHDKNVMGGNLQLAEFANNQVDAVALQIAGEVADDMIAGTASSNKMLGLSYFIKDAASGGQTAALGFTAAQQAAMNSQLSLQINTDANENLLMEHIDKIRREVPGANAIVCNYNLAARLTKIARRLGNLGDTVSQFGVPVQTINKIPIIAVPTTAIASTESDGTNSDCTSMYIVRFAEKNGVAFATNSGLVLEYIKPDSAKPDVRPRVQFFLNLAVERKDAVRRISRIR